MYVYVRTCMHIFVSLYTYAYVGEKLRWNRQLYHCTSEKAGVQNYSEATSNFSAVKKSLKYLIVP